jgi:hypothetical protein
MAHFDPRFSVNIPLQPLLRRIPMETTQSVSASLAVQVLAQGNTSSEQSLDDRNIVVQSPVVVSHTLKDLIPELYQEILPFNQRMECVRKLIECAKQGRLKNLTEMDTQAIRKVIMVVSRSTADFNCVLDLLSIFTKEQMSQHADMCQEIMHTLNFHICSGSIETSYNKVLVILTLCCVKDYLDRFRSEERKSRSERSLDIATDTKSKMLLDILNILHAKVLFSDEEKDLILGFCFTYVYELSSAYVLYRPFEKNDRLTVSYYREIVFSRHCHEILRTLNDMVIALKLKYLPSLPNQYLDSILLCNCLSTLSNNEMVPIVRNLMFCLNTHPTIMTRYIVLNALELILSFNSEEFDKSNHLVNYFTNIDSIPGIGHFFPIQEVEIARIIDGLIQLYKASKPENKLQCLAVIAYIAGYNQIHEDFAIDLIDKNNAVSLNVKVHTLGRFLCSLGLLIKDAPKPLSKALLDKIQEYLFNIDLMDIHYTPLENIDSIFKGLRMLIEYAPTFAKLKTNNGTKSLYDTLIDVFNHSLLVTKYKNRALLILSMLIEKGFLSKEVIDISVVYSMILSSKNMNVSSILHWLNTLRVVLAHLGVRPVAQNVQEVIKMLFEQIEPFIENYNVKEAATLISAMDFLCDKQPKAMVLLQSRLNRQINFRNSRK